MTSFSFLLLRFLLSSPQPESLLCQSPSALYAVHNNFLFAGFLTASLFPLLFYPSSPRPSHTEAYIYAPCLLEAH